MTEALTWNGRVHPAADIFPMLPEDELAELAADIKANGLLHAITLDAEGTLVDGRNRQRGCELAGVAPRYGSLNGHDPVAYVLSANVERRNLSKGQRAMAVARLTLETKLRGDHAAAAVGVSASRVSQAHTVLKHADDLADPVMAGVFSLDDAYAEAKRRKKERDDAVTSLDHLHDVAPDLAVLVGEEKLPLRDALAAYEQRRRDAAEAAAQERAEAEDLTRSFTDTAAMFWSILLDDPERVVDQWVPAANRKRALPDLDILWTADGMHDLARRLDLVADAIASKGGTLP
jgi:hypothetical protein